MARNTRTSPLPDGLYDQLLTESLWTLLQRDELRQAHSLQAVPPDETAQRLSEHLVAQMAALLDTHVADPSAQLHFINHALTALRRKLKADRDAADPVHTPLQSLLSVHRHRPAAEPPETGLSLPWLFTAGKGSPSLLTELRKELAACDHADILVSFITYSGVRKLLDILKSATVGARGCMPRRGCSSVARVSAPLMWAARTCPAPPWRADWNGHSSSPSTARPTCSSALAPTSKRCGKTRSSSATSRRTNSIASRSRAH
ncbi:MAG: hypothetical protein WCY98_11990 [Castellaniella sp.]